MPRFVRATFALALASLLWTACGDPPPAAVGCANDSQCAAGESCKSGVCTAVACPALACADGESCRSGACVATSCPALACGDGETCQEHSCVAATCPAKPCAQGESCIEHKCVPVCDPVCGSGQVCVAGQCVEQKCVGVQCAGGETCLGGTCYAPSCADAACAAGSYCDDGVCTPRSCVGVRCNADSYCKDGECLPAACDDRLKNGRETDVDCGGSTCPACADHKHCKAARDCTSGVCTAGVCQVSTCDDGVRNGPETDVDCGGDCDPCAVGKACVVSEDCVAGAVCNGGTCQAGCLVGGAYAQPGALNPINACQSCHPERTTAAFSADDGLGCGDGLVCAQGACVEGCFVGGAHFSPGQKNPANPCQTCQPQKSTTQFSNADGGDCGSGQVCALGVCRAGCFVNNAYRAAGAPNPLNGCQTCQPQQATHAWSNEVGTSCGDGLVCGGGQCIEGCFVEGAVSPSGAANPLNGCQTCQPAVTTTGFTNANGTSCGTNQICSNGACRSGCLVDGVFRSAGQSNPASTCESCQPATSTSAWTREADGMPCGSGQRCSAGICRAGCWIDGAFVDPDAANPQNPCQSCQPSASGTSWTNISDGSRCGTGSVCHSGACDAGCFIGGQLVQANAVNPQSSCQACRPSVSVSAWSTAANGTACGSGMMCSEGSCVSGCFIDGQAWQAGQFKTGSTCLKCDPSASTSAWTAVPQPAQTFTFTGQPVSYKVPGCTTSLKIETWGGVAGYGCSTSWCGAPGLGGTVSAVVPVSAGETLTVVVGGNSAVYADPWGVYNQGGYNGGQNGQQGSKSNGLASYDGGGGGGASVVKRGDSVLVGAGGGGGGGGYMNSSFVAAYAGTDGVGGAGGQGRGSPNGGPVGGNGATISPSTSSDATSVIEGTGSTAGKVVITPR